MICTIYECFQNYSDSIVISWLYNAYKKKKQNGVILSFTSVL